MFNAEDKIKIINRSNAVVSYRIPENNISRTFNRKEVKTVPFKEITAVAAQPGGRELFYNFLLIEDINVLKEAFNVAPEIEYWLTEEQIPKWLTASSLEEFIDALQFAPEGVKGLIKQYAISTKLNDIAKREAILKYLGIDVTKAIEAEKADQENTDLKNTKPARLATNSSIQIPNKAGTLITSSQTK